MSEATKLSPKGSDWTRLLTDPDLVSHLGKLLQTYREVPAEQRETALLRAMREIKDAAISFTIPNPSRKRLPLNQTHSPRNWHRTAAVFSGSSAMWRSKFALKE
jgi:hypothetical protein